LRIFLGLRVVEKGDLLNFGRRPPFLEVITTGLKFRRLVGLLFNYQVIIRLLLVAIILFYLLPTEIKLALHFLNLLVDNRVGILVSLRHTQILSVYLPRTQN
jgi:hypothetical protein